MQNLFVINAALTQPRRRALLTALIVVFFDVTLALAVSSAWGPDGALRLAPAHRAAGRRSRGDVDCVGLLREKPVLHAGGEAALTQPKVAARACVVTWCNPQASSTAPCSSAAFRAGNSGGW
jgi:L-lysine exporter family protein LysE/ArgO